MNCQRLGCIALAVEGSAFCAVHRVWERVDRVLGVVRPIPPVTDRVVQGDPETRR